MLNKKKLMKYGAISHYENSVPVIRITMEDVQKREDDLTGKKSDNKNINFGRKGRVVICTKTKAKFQSVKQASRSLNISHSAIWKHQKRPMKCITNLGMDLKIV